MSKQEDIVQKLLSVKENENGDINFKFSNGTTQRQPINKQFFYDDKGRPLDLYKVLQNINDICHDKCAISYEIE